MVYIFIALSQMLQSENIHYVFIPTSPLYIKSSVSIYHNNLIVDIYINEGTSLDIPVEDFGTIGFK